MFLRRANIEDADQLIALNKAFRSCFLCFVDICTKIILQLLFHRLPSYLKVFDFR